MSMSSTLRVLTLDIETSPNLAHVWGLWQQNVGLPQLLESGEVICFAAKWHGDRGTQFHSAYDADRGDMTTAAKKNMVKAAHKLLNEADALVGWNSSRFDITHLNREFLEAGLGEPSPYVNLDLIKTVKSKFRFPSNKLDYVAQRLGVGGKVSHTGHKLWLDCLEGDAKAWRLMEKYNRQDVVITDKLYAKLKPWIKNHPSASLYAGTEGTTCGTCGGALTKQGLAYTATSVYQRYKCDKCGKWSRGSKRIGSTDVRGL